MTDKQKEPHKDFSNCFEGMPFAEMMGKMMAGQGAGAICAEMMQKIRNYHFALIARMGMAFITPGLMTAALRAVPESKLNAASGTVNFCRQLGGAFGINTVVALMERRGEFHADALTATQIAGNAATSEYVARAGEVLAPAGHHDALTDLLALEHLSRMIASQANTMAFQDGFLMIALVFVFAMLPAWVMSRSIRVVK